MSKGKPIFRAWSVMGGVRIAEAAPWTKISWTWLPYFSKSFASFVTQRGAKFPTSLVQMTFNWAAKAEAGDRLNRESHSKRCHLALSFIDISPQESFLFGMGEFSVSVFFSDDLRGRLLRWKTIRPVTSLSTYDLLSSSDCGQ